MEDYSMVINECSKVLKKDEYNFKANYRMGLSYFNKKDNSNAKLYFEKGLKSKNLTSNEIDSINEYLKKLPNLSNENFSEEEKKDSSRLNNQNSNKEEKKGNTKKLKDIFDKEKENEKKNEDIQINTEYKEKNTKSTENTCSNTNLNSSHPLKNMDENKINEIKSNFEKMVNFLI